jgi:hypothetical protein
MTDAEHCDLLLDGAFADLEGGSNGAAAEAGVGGKADAAAEDARRADERAAQA